MQLSHTTTPLPASLWSILHSGLAVEPLPIMAVSWHCGKISETCLVCMPYKITTITTTTTSSSNTES